MNQNKAKSFVLYTDYAKHIARLTDEEAGKLFLAIFEYAESGKIPEFSGALMMCFSFIADQIARDKEKYPDVCKKRAEAGRKGGKQKQANVANAKIESLRQANKADNDNGNEYEADNEDGKNKYTKGFQAFWEVYPKKADKGQCYKKYAARIKDGYSPEELLLAATRYSAQCKQQHTDQQYIKHGKTFLGDTLPFTDFLPKLRDENLSKSSDEESKIRSM